MLNSTSSQMPAILNMLTPASLQAHWPGLLGRLKNQVMLLTQAHTPLGYMLVREIIQYSIHPVITVPEQKLIAGWWKEIFACDPHSSCMEENAARPESILNRLLWKYGQLNAVWLHTEKPETDALIPFWKNWVQALSGVLKSNSLLIFSAALETDKPALSKQWLSAANQELNKLLRWLKKTLHPAIRIIVIPPLLYQCPSPVCTDIHEVVLLTDADIERNNFHPALLQMG
ncbi:MAG: hypothetical protein IRZ01_11575 [Thermoflavifilum aggregans]|nr:hypothetical protein [Thermoflavifilum aggregans]